MKEIKRGLKALLITVLAYLIQACVMGHLTFAGVQGSVLFAALAILIVSCGKKYAFCASCIIGMLMECMLSGVNVLYLIAYLVITMLFAQFFADMSDRQREYRSTFKKGPLRRETDLPAFLRIPLCAGLMDLLMSIVLCAYMYLIGVDLSFSHAARAVASMLYTAALAAILMIPTRAFLGMYHRRPKEKKGGELL